MLHGGDGFELLLIAAVALIVVGPKDLPILLRKLGQFVGKMRGMAAEFRASFDEMARQSELDELRKEVEAMRQGQFADQAARATGTEEVNQIFHDIGDSLGNIQLHPPMSHQYDAAAMQASSEMVGETVKTEVAPVAKTRVAKTRAAKAQPARAQSAKAKSAPAKAASKPKPARSAPAKPMAVKAAARPKAAAPAKAKAIATPKAPSKPKSAPTAKAVAAKVPRAPVQRAKAAASPKARSPK
jgi:sec-independent protein translocase protein TatB